MTYWKVQLDAAGSFPGFKVQRYRAVVLAANLDAAVEMARKRLGKMGSRMSASTQPFSDLELACLEVAADHFVNRGFNTPILIDGRASRTMEP